MHKVKTGVQNMYMKCTCTSPRISVTKALRSDCLTFLFAVVFRWSSYLATTVRSAPVVSLYGTPEPPKFTKIRYVGKKKFHGKKFFFKKKKKSKPLFYGEKLLFYGRFE